MKIRTDFVTNSSSSSFVVSKNHLSGEKDLVQETFEMLQSFFVKYKEKLQLAEEYCKKSKCYKFSDGYISYEDEGSTDKYWDDSDAFKEAIGISAIDFSRCDYLEDIIHAKTYKEFVEKYSDKIAMFKYPFVIYTVKELEDKSLVVKRWDSIYNDIANWYMDCPYDRIAENYVRDCENCTKEERSCCDNELSRSYRDSDVKNKEHHIISLFMQGSTVVLSISGNIPYPVVDMMSKVCEYSCNHMG